ncbi:MAG: Cephalosporin hydroxylase [Deltaproteobacteria bacterium]|nr:Cephalosporin hydroxylase [Deltaproteobacteria bacterium]
MTNRFSSREWIMMILIVGLTATVILEELGYMNRPSRQEVVDRFHKLFYDSQIWVTTKWLGVPTAQNPNDAWIHQEIIAQVKPDFIVETGTWHGGSAALWATILQQVNPDGLVITLDINDNVSAAKQLPIVKDKVEFLLGSSVDPAIVAAVTKRVQGKKVLVILDSDHHKNHVLAEMKAYAPLVSKDSYMIVQDTNANGHPVLANFGPGPMEAVDEFLATNDQFRPDREAERLMFTMHPKGYLKRIK